MKKLLILFVLSLAAPVVTFAEVRPDYGSALLGMNRNILQRQRNAIHYGEPNLLPAYNTLLASCNHKPVRVQGKTIRNLGLAYFFSSDEKYAALSAELLKAGIPADAMENVNALIDFLDGILLLEDSKTYTEQIGHEMRVRIAALKELSTDPASVAVLTFFLNGEDEAREYFNPITGNVSKAFANVAEKAGADLRNQIKPVNTHGKLEKAVRCLTHPVFEGTVLSDQDFFLSVLNLDYPGLENVKKDVASSDFTKAKKDFVSYLKLRQGPVWYFNWRDFSNSENRILGYDRTNAEMVASNNLLSVGIRHQFGETVDWMANPTPNKYSEWTWHLNYNDCWAPLKEAYWATGDEKYARVFVKQMRSWVNQSPKPDYMAKVPYSRWRSIEAGMRMLNYWPNAFFGFLASPSFDDESIFIMVKSFYEQGLHLRAYYRTHNWLVKEMFGLFTIGIVFPEFMESAEWCKFSSEKMYAEQSIQFYPCGIHTELSPGYHVGTQRNIYGIYKLATLNNYPLPEGFNKGMEKTYDCFLRSIMPDGTMPANNDSWWTDGRVVLSEGYAEFPYREDFNFVASSGKKGTQPNYTSNWMPYAGWSIMRTGWDKDALYAYFDVGPSGAGHQHEDKLSMIICAYGSKLMTEGATYAYDNSKWRQYIISAAAHNVARVDGMDQNRRARLTESAIKLNKVAQKNRWISNEAFDFSEGWYTEGFGEKNDTTVTQYRALAFIRNRYWLVFDVFTPSDIKTHKYDTWFHLNSDKFIIPEGLNGLVGTKAKSANLAVLSFRKDLKLKSVCGQEEPEVQGWISANGTSGYKCDPIATPIFSCENAGQTVMPYLLYPLRPGETLPISELRMTGSDTMKIFYTDGKVETIRFSTEGKQLVTLSVDNMKILDPSSANDHEWDDTSFTIWPKEFSVVEIPSSKDRKIQKAYLHKSSKSIAQPLIVSLHTWSGGYDQKDRLVDTILKNDWNYIHPDFRGANNNPDAMLSDLVISDIEDAIKYAIQETGADPDNVHIIGASGGGMAALAAYMKISCPVSTFSAWVPISDIGAWYDESTGRKHKYADDILNALGSEGVIDRNEARRRSPLYSSYPKSLRNGVPLFIYAGIHDGYTGSVPVTHSLNIYNRLVGELKYGTSDLDRIARYAEKDPDLITNKKIISLLAKRQNPEADRDRQILGRRIHLEKTYLNIHLTVFEGSHEELPGALELLNNQ